MVFCPLTGQHCDHGYLENGDICSAYSEPIALGYEYLDKLHLVDDSYCVLFGVK